MFDRILYLCDNNDYLKQAQDQLVEVFNENEIDDVKMYDGLNQKSDSLRSIIFASLQNLSKKTNWQERFRYNYVDLVISGTN